MRLVVLDLVGDVRWLAAVQPHRAEYVPLDRRLWTAMECSDVAIIDGRGSFACAIEFMACLPRLGRQAERVLITERELPADHQRAYEAGATRLVLMGLEQTSHSIVLGEIASKGWL